MPVVISGGKLVLADTNQWMSSQTHYAGGGGVDLLNLHASYAYIYKKQLWVYVAVKKRAFAAARLPLKTYRRREGGRDETRDTPYARLLRQPNPRMNRFFLWLWTMSTKDIYGEAMWIKVRDRRSGLPVELWPMHPTNFNVKRDGDRLVYELAVRPDVRFSDRDVVHFKSYNPDNTVRGLSPIEPLRMTLLNEDSARRAQAAFWKNGGRPSITLTHPKVLSKEAADRITEDFMDRNAGVDNFGRPLVLEEGMTSGTLSLSAEEAQYIESRKLNREEVCATYDVPPPVLHILDRATFSNITEQMRSMYRDTMAPVLGDLEGTLEAQLQSEFNDDDSEYAEFLMDEVLRGSFEARSTALQRADWLTLEEKRDIENLPRIPGTDRILVNGAYVPLDQIDQVTKARRGTPEAKYLDDDELSSVLGRLSRQKTLDEVDPEHLTKGLNGNAEIVLLELELAKDAGESVEDLRARVKALGGSHAE